MPDFIFYVFAALAVIGALAVVVNHNPVNGALCLLVSLVGLAGLFVLLDAALLAFVLLLVYAGAVVALFLFIIMLLDTRPVSVKPYRPLSIAAATLGALLLLCGAWSLRAHAAFAVAPTRTAPALRDYAASLFTTYLLPVQIVGFLLLVAMLGVIILSKKFVPVEDNA